MKTLAWQRITAQFRSLIIVVLVTGLGGGAVLAAAIGARRTQTAYPRFITQSRESDVLVGVGCPPPSVSPCQPVHTAFHDQVQALPMVATSGRAPGLEIFPVDGGHIDYGVRVIGIDDTRFGHSIFREKLFAGHVPDPGDPQGIIVNRPLALARHYHVGQVLTDFRAFPGENRPFKPSEGTPVVLRVSAIALGQNEVLVDANTPSGLQILATQAFVRAHESSEAFAFEQVFLRRGVRDLDAFGAAMHSVFAHYPGAPAIVSNNHEGIPRVEQAIRPQVLALALFAVVAGIALVLLVGQALARQTSGEAVEYPVLHALGMTRRQIIALPVARAAFVATTGAVIAVVVAVLASPLTPIGYARIAEPTPGFAANIAWLAGGAGLLAILAVAVSLPSAWFSTRELLSIGGLGDERARTSWIADRITRLGGSAPRIVGSRLALQSGRGRTAVPARTAITAGAASVAVVALVLTFGAGLNRLVGDPSRYGQDWDATVDNVFYPIPLAAVRNAFLAADVQYYAAGNFADVIAEGHTVLAMGIDTFDSPGSPPFLTVIDGRAAVSPDEVALGETTMRELHAHIGETLQFTIGPAPHTLRVVGEVVFPSDPVGTTLRPELGDGAQVVAPLLAAPLPPGAPPGSLYTFFPVRFEPGNRTADLAQLRARVDPSGACPLAPCVDARQEPAPVRSYTSALPIEYILVGFVSLLGLAAVSYVVGASIRRRRRDFAILEAMGLTRRQLWHTLTWQASTIGAIALIVGIPAGILLGRLSWRAFAQALGVGADPLVPGAELGVVAVITALTVLAVAGFFYASFRHSRPAIALRSE